MKKWTLFLGVLLISTSMISCGGKETTSIPAGALKAAPASIQFGTDLAVNTESAVKKFTITNTASVDVTGISYSLLGGQDKIFLVGSDCTSVLVAGAKCNVSASIKPDQKGKAFTETYQVKYNTDKGEEILSVKLSGSTLSSSGVELGNSLYLSGTDGADSTTKTFPNTTFGSVSEVATLGLTYQGAKPVVIQVQSPENRVFRVVSDCVELSSGDRCNLFVSFAPIDDTKQNGKITIIATEEGKASQSLLVGLEGTGVAPTPLSTVVLYPVGDENSKEIDFGTLTKAGELSAPSNVVLKNNGTSEYLYRLTSTLGAISIDYGTCTGKLSPNTDCTFILYYGPSVAGDDKGYVSFVSGKSTAFIKVKGTAAVATAQTVDNVVADKEKIAFAKTEINFSTEQKLVKLTNSSTTTASGKITMGLEGRNTPFAYTTTCVDNAPLRAGGSCDIFVSFRPANTVSYIDNLTISISGSTTKIVVKLEGEGKPLSITDNSTNIPNLTVSAKKYSFPETGVGLKSAAYQFTLTNEGTTDITGFTSTSTDLIRFPLDAEFTTCRPTIPAGESCKIAYKFNATSATNLQAYIKIFANGAEGGSLDEAHELIELSGRGVLFNKYIYFGFVDGSKTSFKDITYATVNDTPYARRITKTEVETVRWEWKARNNNPLLAGEESNASQKSNRMSTWFPSKTGDVVATNIFVKNSLGKAEGNSVDLGAMFSIVSDSCKGQNVPSGGSCIIRIRYDATKQVDNASRQPVSAYIRLYADDDGSDILIDQFHAIASGVDNVTYFFPPEDNIGSKTYERPIVIWDSQGVVIDQNIYTFSGAGGGLPSGYSADNKVRRYDAARNVWVTLRTGGTDFMAMKWANGVSGGQVRMIPYNKKLYFYGGTIRNAGDAFLGMSDYLGVLDLDAKSSDIDATWSTLSLNSVPGGRGQVNMAGYNNKIYLWSGLQQFPRNVYYFDLKDNKWYKAGQESSSSISVADVPEGCTIPKEGDTAPTRRGYAAMIFYGNKLFMQGGMHNTDMDNRGACGGLSVNPGGAAYLYNDLWSYEVESYNDKNEPIHSTDVNKWKMLTDVLGNNSIGITPTQDSTIDEKRPYAREKHEWDIVGNKLLLKASGFAPNNGNSQVNVGPGNYYFFFDPASGGKTTDDPYNGWTKANIDTSSLAQHKLFMVEGAIWFYNRNIMGIQISSEIEALAKK